MNHPTFADGPSGLFLGYMDAAAPGSSDSAAFVRKWIGGGFGPPVVVAPTGVAEVELFQDPSGRLHLVYQRTGTAFWQTSTDGATWSPAVQLLPPIQPGDISRIPTNLEVAAGADGQGWLTYSSLVRPPNPATGERAALDVRLTPLAPFDGVGTATGPLASRSSAALRVLRAGVRNRTLDVRVQLTRRASGELRVTFRAAGQARRFTVPIPGGSASAAQAGGRAFNFRKALTGKQRRSTTGILEIEYDGDADVNPDDVRLRAASGKARLRRTRSLIDSSGNLIVEGTISRRAVGVVRIRYGYPRADGTIGFLKLRAKIGRAPRSGAKRWSVRRKLTSAQAKGGQLAIDFTGYAPRRIRGERTTKQVLP